MPYIRLYYFKDEENIPENDAQDILVFGKPKKEFMDKYYVNIHAYVTEEKFDVKEHKEYLKKIVKKFNFRDNPLNNDVDKARAKELKTHIHMSIGDIIMVDKKYYSVGETKFYSLDK